MKRKMHDKSVGAGLASFASGESGSAGATGRGREPAAASASRSLRGGAPGPPPRGVTRFRLLHGRGLLTVFLLLAFAWSLSNIDWGTDLVHKGGLNALGEIAKSLFRPDLSPGVLSSAVVESWRTVAYAVAGLTVALAIGAPLGVIASGTLASPARARRYQIVPVRLILAFLRSIHELVWAWLFVASIGLSPLAAVFAIGIPYGGILGRIYAELLQDVPEAPLRALRAAGASEWQVFWYGRLPLVLPDILSYTFYRLECGVRSAAIMSFIGLGGLGHEIQLSLDDFAYSRAWTFLFFLVIIITAIDLWSSAIRKRLAA